MQANFIILNYKNECFLFANREDSFIQTLPDSNDIFDFPSKKISHSHIYFFEKIINSLNNDFIFIDVGAYLGTISLLLANHLQKNNINCPFYLFEPNPKNLECIKKSVEKNNLKNINLFNKAVSNCVGKSKFFVKDQNNVIGRLSNRGFEVDVTTIDQEIKIKDKNIIIKIDTEGNELNVLRGSIDLLKNNNCILLIEVHPHIINKNFTTTESFFQFLKNRYELFSVDNIGYPEKLTEIKDEESLINSCKKRNLTDLICVPFAHSSLARLRIKP